MSNVFFSGCDSSEEGTDTEECTGNNCEDFSCDPVYIFQLGECVVDIEEDQDFDGIPDEVDNCREVENTTQADCDQDGLGDAGDEESICGITVSGLITHLQ